jgi:hypothetical protein
MAIRKSLLVALALLVLGAQLYRPDRSNPPVDDSRTLEAGMQVPAAVRGILDRACADCHSHRTTWPWYSHVAPVSWMIANHVREGREHLNLSEWPGRHNPAKLLEEMCEEVEHGAMPLGGYVRLHSRARLSEQDKQTFCGWTRSESARLALAR